MPKIYYKIGKKKKEKKKVYYCHLYDGYDIKIYSYKSTIIHKILYLNIIYRIVGYIYSQIITSLNRNPTNIFVVEI